MRRSVAFVSSPKSTLRLAVECPTIGAREENPMAKVENDVLAEFFRKVKVDERIPDETAEGLKRLFEGEADPKAESIVALLEATTGERLA